MYKSIKKLVQVLAQPRLSLPVTLLQSVPSGRIEKADTVLQRGSGGGEEEEGGGRDVVGNEVRMECRLLPHEIQFSNRAYNSAVFVVKAI